MKIFILLDRSGSMVERWDETKMALTAWMGAIDPKAKVRVWGLAFDDALTWFAHGVTPPEFSADSVAPRAMTALYDAIGAMGEKVGAKVKPGKKAQIVILTDGKENASKQTTRVGAGEIIAGWKEKGFDVVFLGADFDAFGQARDVGVAAGQTMSFDSSNYAETAATMATRSSAYAETGKVREFTDEERAEVLKPAKKPKQA